MKNIGEIGQKEIRRDVKDHIYDVNKGKQLANNNPGKETRVFMMIVCSMTPIDVCRIRKRKFRTSSIIEQTQISSIVCKCFS